MQLTKITKFGKVPLDNHLMILTKDNIWGYGYFFKWLTDSCGEKADGKIYCNFWSPESTRLGDPKSEFAAYMEFPECE